MLGGLTLFINKRDFGEPFFVFSDEKFMLNIKKKSFEQLSRQTEQAQEVLGAEFFYNTERMQENLELDEKDLKEKYPYKHSQYVEILRFLAKIKTENLRNLRKLEEETGEKIVVEELKSEQGIT